MKDPMEKTISSSTDVEDLTTFFPALDLNAKPWFNYAVYSVRDGSDKAELQTSFLSRTNAEQAFRRYQTRGFTDTTLFLIHWSKQRTLRIFHVAEKATEPQR